MTVKQADNFYEADGASPDWSKIQGRARFNGSTYENMLEWGLYLYTAPTPYDAVIQNLGAFVAVMQDDEQVGITREVIEKTVDEITSETEAQKAQEIWLAEKEGSRLFFHLCHTLIQSGVLNANDPNMSEIKTAYQKWKDLSS